MVIFIESITYMLIGMLYYILFNHRNSMIVSAKYLVLLVSISQKSTYSWNTRKGTCHSLAFECCNVWRRFLVRPPFSCSNSIDVCRCRVSVWIVREPLTSLVFSGDLILLNKNLLRKLCYITCVIATTSWYSYSTITAIS